MRKKVKAWLWYGGGILALGIFFNQTECHLNESESLPHGFFMVVKNMHAKRGHFVSIKGHQPQYINYTLSCIKEIVGLPGDTIDIRNQDLYINDVWRGPLRHKTKDGRTLTPLKIKIIPKGYIFVRGHSRDTYDSRYEEFGLVKETHLKGRAFGFFKRQRHD